jgi:hypothetical protein
VVLPPHSPTKPRTETPCSSNYHPNLSDPLSLFSGLSLIRLRSAVVLRTSHCRHVSFMTLASEHIFQVERPRSTPVHWHSHTLSSILLRAIMDAMLSMTPLDLVLHSFCPVIYCIDSSTLYFICIRLPYRRRLLVDPALLTAAVLSLTSSWRLAWLNGADNLWALLMCGWILHSVSSLCIEKRVPQDSCPAPLPRLSVMHASYKLYNDPRGVGQPREPLYQFRDISTKPPALTCARFCFWRVFKMSVLQGTQVWFIGPAIAASFDFTAGDFGPKQEVFIRRLLLEEPSRSA